MRLVKAGSGYSHEMFKLVEGWVGGELVAFWNPEASGGA